MSSVDSRRDVIRIVRRHNRLVHRGPQRIWMELLERRFVLSASTSLGDGLYRIDLSGGADTELGMALQADGKLLLAGWSQGGWTLSRLNADKSIDTSFGSDGVIEIDERNANLQAGFQLG